MDKELALQLISIIRFDLDCMNYKELSRDDRYHYKLIKGNLIDLKKLIKRG